MKTVLLAALLVRAVFVSELALSQVGRSAEDRALDDIIASGFIEFGVYRDFPPYSYTDAEGSPVGIDVEIGKQIAAGLGLEARWFWITPDESLEDDLRNAIWKGSMLDRTVADVMLRVPYDREYSYAIDGYGLPKHEHVVFFGPYQEESWAIARDLAKTGDVRNLAIFAYEKVGVEIASLPDMILSGAYNGRLRNNVSHYRDVFGAIDALRAGEVAAVVGMRTQIAWGLRADPGAFDVDNDGLHQLAKLEWDIGAAVKQNHRQLSYAVGDVLDAMVRDGRMANIFADYAAPYSLPSTFEADE